MPVGAASDTTLAEGSIERIGLPTGRLWAHDQASGAVVDEPGAFQDHQAAVQAAFATMEKLQLPVPDAVGHRIGHGGADHIAPEQVDTRLLEDLRRLVPYAPLHLPAEIQGIEAVTARFPQLAQVVCFDTAFHRRMPELARRFPLPRVFWDEGVRRYGFHGLSYEYIIDQVGNGASMAAVHNEQPMDTTMGFTPTGGFMMGTRTGDLDPGLLSIY